MITTRDPEAAEQFEVAVHELLVTATMMLVKAKTQVGPPSVNFSTGMGGAALYAWLSCMACSANKNGLPKKVCNEILLRVHKTLFPEEEAGT